MPFSPTCIMLQTQTQHGQVDSKLLSEIFFTWNIVDAFEKGKVDHYYTLTIRNMLISFLGFGCLGIVFYLPALFTAKSVWSHTQVSTRFRF